MIFLSTTVYRFESRDKEYPMTVFDSYSGSFNIKILLKMKYKLEANKHPPSLYVVSFCMRS